MISRRLPTDVVTYRLPEPRTPGITVQGFMACPVAVLQLLSPVQLLYQSAVYEMAFAQTQADLRPSLPERDLLAVWN
jgi:hypothetical protein